MTLTVALAVDIKSATWLPVVCQGANAQERANSLPSTRLGRERLAIIQIMSKCIMLGLVAIMRNLKIEEENQTHIACWQSGQRCGIRSMTQVCAKESLIAGSPSTACCRLGHDAVLNRQTKTQSMNCG